MSMSRRSLLAAGASVAMAGRGVARAAAALPVRIAVLHSGLFTVIHEVAVQNGHYARNGIDPKVTNIRSGEGTAGIESVLRGSLDVYIGTPVELARVDSQAVSQGKAPPLAIIAAGTPNFSNLVLRKGLAYRTPQDLKGLRIGVSSPGSDHLVNFRFLLSEQHLTTEDLGMRFIPLGAPDMLTALVSSQIDGFLHSEPTVSTALIKAGATLAISGRDFGTSGNSPGLSVNTSRAWVAAHRTEAAGLIASLWDASREYPSLPKAKVLELYQIYQPGEPEILARAYDNLDPRLHEFRQMADAWWRVNVAAMKTRGEVVETLQMPDLFDMSFSA